MAYAASARWMGVHSVPTPGRLPSSATVSNIFISNVQQLLQENGFLGPHVSGYPRIQLFIIYFPSNKVNNFFDGGTVPGTGSCRSCCLGNSFRCN